MSLQIIDMHYVDFKRGKHVRIDRKSKLWGNPFVLVNKKDEEERIEVLWKYTLHLLRNTKMRAAIPSLEGKILACWCYPRNKCHGQILGYLVEHPEVLDSCTVSGINREIVAEKIFEGLGWEHKKKHIQLTLFEVEL
jgi:Domain of unknown function (DUF4326)